MKSIFLNLEKEVFRGNLLDITCDGRGIIYNANKYYDSSIEIDYLESSLQENHDNIGYDSCVMFFSLHNYFTNGSKKELFRNLYNMLNKRGYIYIWDINKELFKHWSGDIKVLLPDKSIVDFKIKNLNYFEDSTPDKVINCLSEYFQVTEKVQSDNCFKIVARRKDDMNNESSFSCSKF